MIIVHAKVGSNLKAFGDVHVSREDCEWRVLCGDIDQPFNSVTGGWMYPRVDST